MMKTAQDVQRQRAIEAEKRDLSELVPLTQSAAADARELSRLSRKQTEAIATGDIDSLVQALIDREPIVARLVEAHHGIVPVLERLTARGKRSEHLQEDHVKVRSMLAELDELITRVNIQDAADQMKLAQHRQSLGEQLAGLSAGRTAMSAYGGSGSAAAEPMFQDRNG